MFNTTSLQKISRLRQGGDWKSKVEYLRALRQELNENFQILTEYEKKSAYRTIAEESAALEPVIIAGALAEWDQALTRYQAADEAVKQARMREIMSWDPNPLNEEIKHYRTLIAGVMIEAEEPGQALEQLRQEALLSGDRVKVRALAEALAGKARSHGMDLETKLQVNSVAQNADRDLQEIRENAEIRQAREAARVAAAGITQAENVLFDAGTALGTVPPNQSHTGITAFEQARQRVVADRKGNIQQILPKQESK